MSMHNKISNKIKSSSFQVANQQKTEKKVRSLISFEFDLTNKQIKFSSPSVNNRIELN